MGLDKKVVGFVLLENGNVALKNDLGQTVRIITSTAQIDRTQDNLSLIIKQSGNNDVLIHHKDVQYTQILPDAAIPFDPQSESIEDLMSLLGGSFFFDKSSFLSSFNAYPSAANTLFEEAYGTRSTATSLTPNQLYGANIEIKAKCIIHSARIRVVLGAVGSAVIGLYKFNPSDGKWTLVGQTDPSTPFDLNIVAPAQMIDFTEPVIVGPGIYARVILASASATIYHSDLRSASTYHGSSATISTTDYFSGVNEVMAYTPNLPSEANFTLSNLGLLPYTQFKLNL